MCVSVCVCVCVERVRLDSQVEVAGGVERGGFWGGEAHLTRLSVMAWTRLSFHPVTMTWHSHSSQGSPPLLSFSLHISPSLCLHLTISLNISPSPSLSLSLSPLPAYYSCVQPARAPGFRSVDTHPTEVEEQDRK